MLDVLGKHQFFSISVYQQMKIFDALCYRLQC